MTLVMIVLVAGGLGAWLRRWWLLALPVAAVLGAAFLLAMPGTHVDPDNPLLFVLVAMEVALAAGIVLGQYGRRSVRMA